MNDPKIAIAVFVENSGWGSDVAAPIAGLIAERYIHKRTISKHIANRMMNAYYLPPIERVDPIHKPAPRRSQADSTGHPRRTDSISAPKSVAPKPMMTIKPRPVQTAGVGGY